MTESDEEGDPTSVRVAIDDAAEHTACTPSRTDPGWFNHGAVLPYGCTLEHIRLTMEGFLDFLGFVNLELYKRSIVRFESLLAPANFSSVVGEYAVSTLPDFCLSLVKNRYHNGHPDTLPAGTFAGDAVKHATEGVEIKASRRNSGWQGHNAEQCWLMVFVFDSNRPADSKNGVAARPFTYKAAYLARLEESDWKFSGRKEGSKRTITASVTGPGRKKLLANWVYHFGGKYPGWKPPKPPKKVRPARSRRGKPPGS